MPMDQSSLPLCTEEDPGGSTGWRAPMAPTDKLTPHMDQVMVLAQELGIASAPSMHKCHRA